MAELFKNKIFHNTGIKIFSILFAIIFWFYVMDQVNPKIIKKFEDIEINIMNTQELEKEGYILASGTTYLTDIEIEGRRREILDLSKDELDVYANIMSYRDGFQNIQVKSRVLRENLKIVNLSKDTIFIEIDQIIEKTIPVRIFFEGELPENYIQKNTTITPAEVAVKGPENKVTKIEYLKGLVDVSELTDTLNQEIAIRPVDSNQNEIKNLELGRNYIEFGMQVSKVKAINIKPQIVNNLSEEYKLVKFSYYPETILVEGEKEAIDSLDHIFTEEIVLNDLSNDFSGNVFLSIPEDVKVQGNDKVSVSYEIESVITKEYKFDINSVAILNLDSKYDFELLNPSKDVIVSVKGIESDVSAIQKEDLELQVDGKTLEVGVNQARLKISNPNASLQYKLSQDFIGIQLKEIEQSEATDTEKDQEDNGKKDKNQNNNNKNKKDLGVD